MERKKAIEVIKKNWPDSSFTMLREALETLIPELKESEGERTRKELIAFVKSRLAGFPECDRFIGWIEKQGENPNNVYDKELSEILGRVIRRYINDPNILYAEREKVSMEIIPYVERLEKQGEQKPTDKVKPKFKVGDFIVNDYCMGKVIELTNDAYLLDTGQGIPFYHEHNAHLWTIQDAKDGDVLVNDFHLIFIFKEIKNDMYISHCSIIDRDNDVIVNSMAEREVGYVNLVKCQPATKEQRDLLFQKIKEAGYEWDAEKKELRKIEPRQEELTEFEKAVKHVMEEAIECGDTHNLKADADLLLRIARKTSWSEEDEHGFENCLYAIKETFKEVNNPHRVGTINWLKSLKDRVQPQPKQEWSDYDECMLTNLIDDPNCSIDSEYVHWLKDLKYRYNWKPSDEQIDALEDAIADAVSSIQKNMLNSLYNDLMKLMEE